MATLKVAPFSCTSATGHVWGGWTYWQKFRSWVRDCQINGCRSYEMAKDIRPKSHPKEQIGHSKQKLTKHQHDWMDWMHDGRKYSRICVTPGCKTTQIVEDLVGHHVTKGRYHDPKSL